MLKYYESWPCTKQYTIISNMARGTTENMVILILSFYFITIGRIVWETKFKCSKYLDTWILNQRNTCKIVLNNILTRIRRLCTKGNNLNLERRISAINQ